MSNVFIKRIYEAADKNDGFRILIDRLWPRGISKEKANVDAWFKETAPSSELRKWFNHDPEKWKEFIRKYKDELRKSGAADELKSYIKKYKTITLLYAAHDTQYNNAVALQSFIKHSFN